jgi:hypothetical protein
MDPELLRFMKKTIVQFGEEFEDNKFVMQFIPIVLMLLFSLYTQRFIEVANSVLGKLLAVVVIIFYTKLNILYGVCACVIIILFYQLTATSNATTSNATTSNATTVNAIEGMKNPKNPKKSIKKPSVTPPVVTPLAAVAGTAAITGEEDLDVEDGTNLPDKNDLDMDNDANDVDESNDMDTEGFESYKNLYPVINIEDFNAAKKEFIKEKCRNGVIMYKDMPVKPEMVDHVFSEVHFTTDTKCNPCDRTCAYSIIENKLATEEELGRPKNSNDVFAWFSHLFTKRA